MIKGSKHSEESKKKSSEAHKKLYEDPEYCRKMIELRKKYFDDPIKYAGFCKNISDRQKLLYRDPVYKNKMSQINIGRKQSEEVISNRVEKNMGQKRTEETKRKMSIVQKRICNIPENKRKTKERAIISHNTPEAKINHSLAMKKLWQDPEYKKKLILAVQKSHSDPEYLKKFSKIQKEIWSTKEGREKRSEITTKVWVDSRWYGNVKYDYGPQYCELWTPELRERVRAYWGYKCVECGMTEEENNRKLAVHHVHYNKNTCCDSSPRVLVPLCVGCHGKTNVRDREGRKEWEEHFIKIVYSLDPEGKCFFTKEEMKEFKK